MSTDRKIFPWLVVVLLASVVACKRQKTDANEHSIQIPNEQFVSYMKNYLDKGFLVKMVPKGNSMLPTLQNGKEVVGLKQTKEIKKGDIVLALTNYGHYVIHRVMRIEGEIVILKGDHNKSTETALLENVMAKLVSVEPMPVNMNRQKEGFVDERTVYKANPYYRIDTVDSLAWMVDTVKKQIDMHKVITFNETASFIWNNVKNKEFSIQDMNKVITDMYEVDSLTVYNDCKRLLRNWMDCELVVEMKRR